MQPILDDIDIRILQVLQVNGRLSSRQVGEKLHRSANPTNVRIRRLEEEGIIKKYVAILDHEKLNLGFVTFTHVQLKDQSRESLGHFESEIVKFTEVLECFHVTGDYDFILRVAVKDRHVYHDFLMNKLFAIISVGNVLTTIVMKEAKSETALPLGPKG